MEKPIIIQELEKTFNFKATEVDFKEIKRHNYYQDQEFEYVLDKDGEIIGLKIIELLQEIISKEFLKTFTNLLVLDLSVNNLTNVEFLKELTKLTWLNVGINKIENIKPLKVLLNLSCIKLSYNQITNIEPLKELKNLTELELYKNQITNIEPLQDLKNLVGLYLSDNQITNIESLKGLKNLIELILTNNQITSIEPLKGLKNLAYLYLVGNQITDIKPLKPLIRLQDLQLNKNPIKNNLNFKITDDGHIQAKQLKSWFTLSAKTEKVTLPIKILLLGNSKIGKTCLQEFLNKKTYCSNSKSTHVLEVVPFKDQNATIWDFGGQDYYHSVHHLFFTLSSLYIVMYDEATNKNKYLENENHYNFTLDYWLKNLEYITPNKTDENKEKKIMLIENKIDENKEFIPVDKHKIKNKYRINLCIDDKTPKKDSIHKKRLDLLKAEIINEIEKLENDNKIEFSITINKVIEKIINKEFDKKTNKEFKYYYSRQEFLKTCNKDVEITIKDKHLDSLFASLRDAGLILYFNEDDVWLYPDLLIKKIHAILGQEEIKNKSQEEISALLKRKTKKLKDDNLLELLLKQEVLFKDGKELIFPQYLPVKSKNHVLYNIAKTNLKPAFSLKFNTFLPSAFMSRVICRFGKQKKIESEQRFYRRYEIIFIDKVVNEDIRVWIKTDLEKLEVDIYLSDIKNKKAKEDYIKYLFKALIVAYEGNTEHYNFKKYKSEIEKNAIPLAQIEFVNNESAVNYVKHYIDNMWFFNFEEFVPNDLNINVNGFEVKYENLKNINGKRVTTINNQQIYNNIFNPFTRTNLTAPKKLFISYSHKDYNYLERLETHLSSLRRDGLIVDWNDTKFELGEHWNDKIKEKLNEADIVILLISADFINSNYINDVELPLIQELEKKDQTKIYPVIVEYCDWESQKYYNYIQAGPMYIKNEDTLKEDKKEIETVRPIENWENPSRAYTQIVKKIRKYCED